MASLGVMKSNLTLMSMSGLVQTDIVSLLNKCQQEELESYEWSFLYTDIVINSIIGYNTGTITLTQGSPTVTGSGTTFPTTAAGWFLWAGPTLTTPVIIKTRDSATQLTLSTDWGNVDQNGTTYTIQPLYYSVSPLIEVYSVRQIDELGMTSQADLNRKDPSRIATGAEPCLEWAQAPFQNVTSDGFYQLELWPRPGGALPYIISGKQGGFFMMNDSDLPVIPSQVLEAKAMMYLCRSTFANNGNPKWLSLAQEYRQDYMTELEKAQHADKQRVVPQGIPMVRNLNYGRPFDAAIDYKADFWGPPYVGA